MRKTGQVREGVPRMLLVTPSLSVTRKKGASAALFAGGSFPNRGGQVTLPRADAMGLVLPDFCYLLMPGTA